MTLVALSSSSRKFLEHKVTKTSCNTTINPNRRLRENHAICRYNCTTWFMRIDKLFVYFPSFDFFFLFHCGCWNCGGIYTNLWLPDISNRLRCVFLRLLPSTSPEDICYSMFHLATECSLHLPTNAPISELQRETKVHIFVEVFIFRPTFGSKLTCFPTLFIVWHWSD